MASLSRGPSQPRDMETWVLLAVLALQVNSLQLKPTAKPFQVNRKSSFYSLNQQLSVDISTELDILRVQLYIGLFHVMKSLQL